MVRGIAGALQISWDEALDRLSEYGITTVNSRGVYPRLLQKEGFVRHGPLLKAGKPLHGDAFCREMARIYQKGERIFASLGKSHVTAVVPIAAGNGAFCYRFADCWDSSGRRVGEYRVRPARTGQPAACGPQAAP